MVPEYLAHALSADIMLTTAHLFDNTTTQGLFATIEFDLRERSSRRSYKSEDINIRVALLDIASSFVIANCEWKGLNDEIFRS